MGLQNKNGLQYVIFDNLNQTGLVNHCFTTRLGGVSKGPFAQMNLSTTRGDNLEDVLENYRILSQELGFDYDSFVSTYQTHTTNIRHVTKEEKGKGFANRKQVKEIDGLITNVPGINLTIFGADCVPVFLVDRVKRVIGVAHAGWRGTAEGIAAKMVKEMVEYYGTSPEHILAGIGPSIGKCCFQVDEPVVKLFREKLSFAEEVIFEDSTEKGKYKIDLWQTNKKLLVSMGVLEENIEITGLCTMCRPDLFFSHRVMGNARGNMAGILSLKE